MVQAGDVVAVVKDDKVDFQINAIDAQLLGLQASLKNAEAELPTWMTAWFSSPRPSRN